MIDVFLILLGVILFCAWFSYSREKEERIKAEKNLEKEKKEAEYKIRQAKIAGALEEEREFIDIQKADEEILMQTHRNLLLRSFLSEKVKTCEHADVLSFAATTELEIFFRICLLAAYGKAMSAYSIDREEEMISKRWKQLPEFLFNNVQREDLLDDRLENYETARNRLGFKSDGWYRVSIDYTAENISLLLTTEKLSTFSPIKYKDHDECNAYRCSDSDLKADVKNEIQYLFDDYINAFEEDRKMIEEGEKSKPDAW